MTRLPFDSTPDPRSQAESPLEQRLRSAMTARADTVTEATLRPGDVPIVAPTSASWWSRMSRRNGVALAAAALSVTVVASAATAGVLTRDSGVAGTESVAPADTTQPEPTASSIPSTDPSAGPSDGTTATTPPAPQTGTASTPTTSVSPQPDGKDITVAGVTVTVPESWGKTTSQRHGDITSACVTTADDACLVTVQRNLLPAGRPLIPDREVGGIPPFDWQCPREPGFTFPKRTERRTFTQRGEVVTFTVHACDGDPASEHLLSWVLPRSGVTLHTFADPAGSQRRLIDEVARSVRVPNAPAVPGRRSTILPGITAVKPNDETIIRPAVSPGKPQLAIWDPSDADHHGLMFVKAAGRVDATAIDGGLSLSPDPRLGKDMCGPGNPITAGISVQIRLDGRDGTFRQWACPHTDIELWQWIFPEHGVVLSSRAPDDDVKIYLTRLVQSTRFS